MKGQGHYIPGFHIITRLEDAKYFRDKNKGWYPNWKIFKCEYTGILAQGFESRNLSIKEPIRVDVASHILIHSTPLEE